LAQARPQRIGVAVRGEQHALGVHHRPVGGGQFPAPAIASESGHARTAADLRACFLRSAGQPASVTQRLHGPGAAIDPAAVVDRAPGEPAYGVAVEYGHGRAAPLPLFGSACDNADISDRESRLDPTASPRVAVDFVARDQIEYGVR